MPKNRILYNCQALYIGPSPSSGYHFVDSAGIGTNDITNPNNFNAIKRINRVTNLSYNINLPREQIKQMGKSALASNLILNSPTIQVDFEYYLNGVTNEARIGFDVNHTLDLLESGRVLYTDNKNFLFNGFCTYDKSEITFGGYLPPTNKSSKNIFAVVTKEENEDEIVLKNSLISENFKRKEENVICFGDGYINNYETSCGVGQTPKARVGFICDNVIFYTGSSGLGIPAVNPKTLENYSGIKFAIPEEPVVNDITVILPGNITVDIQQTGDNSSVNMENITSFGTKFSDVKIQDYNIGIRFDREDMNSISYRAPQTRRINFPIEVTFNFSSLIGDESETTLSNIIKQDQKYNVTIKMKNRSNEEEIVRYDFKNASLETFGYTSSISENRRLTFNFKVNATPDNLDEGMFISGILTSISSTNFLLDQNGTDFIVTDNDDYIITNLIPIY